MKALVSESANPACWTGRVGIDHSSNGGESVSHGNSLVTLGESGHFSNRLARIASWSRFASVLDLTSFTMMAKVKC